MWKMFFLTICGIHDTIVSLVMFMFYVGSHMLIRYLRIDLIKMFMLTCLWRSAGLMLHSETTHPGLFNLSYRTSCLMSLGLLHWPRGVDKPHLLLPSCPPVRHLPDNSPCLAVMSAWHLVKKNRDMIARKVRAQGRGPHVGPTVTCCSNFNLGVGEREMVVFLVLAYVCKRLH